jgi:hypothetical protein
MRERVSFVSKYVLICWLSAKCIWGGGCMNFIATDVTLMIDVTSVHEQCIDLEMNQGAL